MKAAGNTIELSIGSSFEFLELVSSITINILQMIGFDDDTAQWVELSVRESVINAIKHGNKEDPSKPVDVKFVIGEKEVNVFVRDRGEGFDPSQLPDPLDPENLLNPNGRGIFYMRTFMDEIEYLQHPEGGTIVRMKKMCKAKE